MLKDVTKKHGETKAVIVVTGMQNDDGASQVHDALRTISGVNTVVVDWPRNEVIVTYNPDKVDVGILGDVIKDVGYNVGGVI